MQYTDLDQDEIFQFPYENLSFHSMAFEMTSPYRLTENYFVVPTQPQHKSMHKQNYGAVVAKFTVTRLLVL
jgi:hypothetical protein